MRTGILSYIIIAYINPLLDLDDVINCVKFHYMISSGVSELRMVKVGGFPLECSMNLITLASNTVLSCDVRGIS